MSSMPPARGRPGRGAGLLWATAVAADLAAGLPARPRFAIGGEPTVEGREALDQLLTDVGWDPADPPRPRIPLSAASLAMMPSAS